MDYKRFDNESDEELIYRVCSDKDRIGSWQLVADILNKLLGTEYTESKFRKQFQSFEKMLNANRSKFTSSNEEIDNINQKIRELEKAKIQYRDERSAWNRQNYIDARVSQKFDYLEEKLSDIGKIEFKPFDEKYIDSDKDMLVIVSDWHIGACFKSVWGEYNSDIAKDRIGQLIVEINKIQNVHKCKNCYVGMVGDTISGNIHKSIQITNREDVIDQIKIAAELLANFIYQLSKVFENVYFTDVPGNHSRCDRKDDALHDERLDSLVSWGVDILTYHITNIHKTGLKYDSGISEMSIKDKDYVFCHGDFDSFSKKGVSDMCMFLKHIPYAICFGHLHHPSFDESNGVKMIRSGSLCGTGDQYTIEKRLYGKPSQMVCICSNTGVDAYYPVELD